MGKVRTATIRREGRMNRVRRIIRKNIHYYILLLIPLLYILVFSYGPIIGNVLAFRKYVPGGSIYGEEWVGLRYFKMFLGEASFWRAFHNTWLLNIYHLVFTVPVSILFALIMNEIHSVRMRNIVQTISYLPNFFSIVVVVGLMTELLSPTYGLVNELLGQLGISPIFFLNNADWFRTLYISSEIWQFTGWNSIIFFAAITSIDKQLYEAADMDGAGRLQKIWHVTLPQIMPTIVVVYIMSLGHLMSVAFEKVLLMYTPSNSERSDVIETLVYRIGIQGTNYSYSTAISLFSGLLGLLIVVAANYLSKKYTRYSLY
ncbi:protein lplB [Paenibacillus sp. IHB B 3415]|nr:protein lplB [Paenibacillus sp. IHB B 3415]